MKSNGRFYLSTILAMILGVTGLAAQATNPQGVSPGAADRTTGTPGRCPTFIWETVDGAASYEVVVYEVTEALDRGAMPELTAELECFRTTVSGRTNSWTPELARCFSPGGSYVWFVRAVLGENGYPEVTEWSEGLFFTVAAAPTTDEVVRALDVLRRHVGDETTDLEGFENLDYEPTYKIGTDARRRRSTARGEPKADPRSVITGTAAIRGEMPDPSGETYGVVGVSSSPGGAGLAAANTAGGADLVLDGSADLETDTELRQSGIDRPWASAQTFNIENSGGGGMTLLVDGVETVTIATDSDTLGGLTCGGNEVAKWNGSAWVCAPDDDADTLGGLTCGGNEVAKWNGSAWACAPDDDADTLGGLTCGGSEVAKWNGSAWVCAPDDDADTLGGLTCGGSEVAKWNGSAWVCAPDLDTDTLGGLACPSGQVAKRNGTVWTCAPDDDTLAGMSCALGQVAKLGFGSTWACAPDNDTHYSFGRGLTTDNGQVVIDPAAFLPRISSLDSTGSVGHYSSVAIGSDGLGLVSYYDGTNGDLKVAHCDDVLCTSATISTIDSANNVGMYTSIAIGVDNLGLISYYDATNKDLKAAHCENTLCTTATVTALDLWTDTGKDTSVAIGADGLGLISYHDQSDGGSLKVAHCQNTACTGATLSTLDIDVGAELYSSITIGADGLGLISYHRWDASAARLMVAHCNNTTCTGAAVSNPRTNLGGSLYGNTSVAIGADGLGLISYSLAGLEVAHCDDLACTSVTWESLGTPDGNSSLAIDDSGYGLISVSPTSLDLMVIRCHNTDCSRTTLSTLEGVSGSSVAIGADGLGLVSGRSGSDLTVVHLPYGY